MFSPVNIKNLWAVECFSYIYLNFTKEIFVPSIVRITRGWCKKDFQ